MNTTTSLANYTMKTYYDRKLLEKAKTQFVYASFGQKRPMPKNNGKTVEFRRFNLLTPNTALDNDEGTGGQQLREGVVPQGQNLSQTKVEATVAQYGAYVTLSDMLDLTAYDPVISESTELLGDQIGRVIEWVTRDAMIADASVQTATGNLTVDEVRKAVRTLKKNKARPFSGSGRGNHFVCIVDPDVAYDLMGDTKWQTVREYQDKEAIYNGELGKMYGVVFVESTEGSTAGSKHHSLIFGADAYGIIDIAGSGSMQSIIKPAGSAGSADPLNQISTVGCKVMAYTAKVLNPSWIIDIRTGATA